MAITNTGIPGAGQVGLTAGQQAYDEQKAKERADFDAWDAQRTESFAGLSATPSANPPIGQPPVVPAATPSFRQDPDYPAWRKMRDAIEAGVRSGGRASSYDQARMRTGNTMSPYEQARQRTGSTTPGYEQALRRITGEVNRPTTTAMSPFGMTAQPAQAPANAAPIANQRTFGRLPSFYSNATAPGKGLTAPESGITMSDATRGRYGIKPLKGA